MLNFTIRELNSTFHLPCTQSSTIVTKGFKGRARKTILPLSTWVVALQWTLNLFYIFQILKMVKMLISLNCRPLMVKLPRNEHCVQLLLHLYIQYAPPTLVSTILSDTGSEWNPGQGKSFESETGFMWKRRQLKKSSHFDGGSAICTISLLAIHCWGLSNVF